MKWLEELDRLERKASPGPWCYVVGYGFNFHPTQDGHPTVNTELACLIRNHARELIDAAKERDLLTVKVETLDTLLGIRPRDSTGRSQTAEKECDNLRALLRRVEWSECGSGPYCNVCMNYKETGHAKHCELAAALGGDNE